MSDTDIVEQIFESYHRGSALLHVRTMCLGCDIGHPMVTPAIVYDIYTSKHTEGTLSIDGTIYLSGGTITNNLTYNLPSTNILTLFKLDIREFGIKDNRDVTMTYPENAIIFISYYSLE